MTRSQLPAVIPQGTVEHFGGQDRIDLIRDQFAKGVSHSEFALFLAVAERTGLDPFARQIYAIPRGGKMTIQTGIDGYRAIADRSGTYAGSDRPRFEYDAQGNLEAAEVTIHKIVAGHVTAFVGVAYWDEYAQKGGLWEKMARTMLAKCAEAQALRKAFPSQLGGVYTHDEMAQADGDQDPWRPYRDSLIARAHALPDAARARLKANHPDPRRAQPDELEAFRSDLVKEEDDVPAEGEVVDDEGAGGAQLQSESPPPAPHPAMEHTLNAARFDKPLDVAAVPITPADIAKKAQYAIDQRARAQTRQTIADAVDA